MSHDRRENSQVTAPKPASAEVEGLRLRRLAPSRCENETAANERNRDATKRNETADQSL